MKRRKHMSALAAVALTGALAMMASGVAAGAGSRPAGASVITVSLSVKGASGATAHEQVGQKATFVAQASKLPAGDDLVIAGRLGGASKWFKVATCGSAHCIGSHAEKKPATDSFEAVIVHGTALTAVVAKSKLVKVIWQAKTALPSLSIADAATSAGNSGGTLTFTVSLSKASAKAVSVQYATGDGAARAGNDYTAANGTLSIPAGLTNGSINVTVTRDVSPDAGSESAETFTVNLSAAVNARIGRASATGTITNDDPPPVQGGHYAGTTADNEMWAFDVSADGTSLTNLHTGQINESCTPPDFTLAGGNLTDPGPVQVNPDGTFSISGTINGSVGGNPSTDVITITGKINPDGTASGTYKEDTTFTDSSSGTAYSCTSGNQTWTATKQS